MHFLCQIKPGELEASPFFMSFEQGVGTIVYGVPSLGLTVFVHFFFFHFSNGVLLSTFMHPLCAPEAELRPHEPALSSSLPLVFGQ